MITDYRVKGLTAADMTEAAFVAALKTGNAPVPTPVIIIAENPVPVLVIAPKKEEEQE